MDAFTPNWHFSETILLVVNPHADAEFELIMTRASTRCCSESRGNQPSAAIRSHDGPVFEGTAAFSAKIKPADISGRSLPDRRHSYSSASQHKQTSQRRPNSFHATLRRLGRRKKRLAHSIQARRS